MEGGWDDPVPQAHEPVLGVTEMVGKLQGPLVVAATRSHIEPRFLSYVAALTAIRLVAAGHVTGLLAPGVGKALAASYLVIGSKTVPPPLPHRR